MLSYYTENIMQNKESSKKETPNYIWRQAYQITVDYSNKTLKPEGLRMVSFWKRATANPGYYTQQSSLSKLKEKYKLSIMKLN